VTWGWRSLGPFLPAPAILPSRHLSAQVRVVTGLPENVAARACGSHGSTMGEGASAPSPTYLFRGRYLLLTVMSPWLNPRLLELQVDVIGSVVP
jgi:hypothetical protein